MPVYEYKCKLCDDRFEIEQGMNDDPLTSLPGCDRSDDGDHLLKKVFSAVGISFKGGGFYRNDARKGSSSTAGDKGSNDGAPNGKGSNDKASNGKSSGEKSSGNGSDSSSSSSSGSSDSSSSTPSTAASTSSSSSPGG